MGGIISLGVCVFAAILLYERGKSAALIFAIVVIVINLWSFGVMNNFKNNPNSAPNFATVSSILTTFTGMGLLIYSFF